MASMSRVVFYRTVLMNLHNAAIHHQVLQVSVSSKCIHHLYPNAFT